METPHKAGASWLFAFAFFIAALMLALTHVNEFWQLTWALPTFLLIFMGLILTLRGILAYMRPE